MVDDRADRRRAAPWPTSSAWRSSRRPDDDLRRRSWRGRRARCVPSPGVPDHHPVFAAARRARRAGAVRVRPGRRRWDDRPLVAITGTDGKTTVTELARAMFEAGGRRAVAVGNTEVPLVAAIDDPTVDVFVVEASSFRLLHSHRFAPDVGHLAEPRPRPPRSRGRRQPRHHDDYVAAKARIWTDQAPGPGRHRQRRRPVVAAQLAARSRPPGHLRARALAPTTGSTATGSCSTPATRSRRSTSSTAPSRTTSPTRSAAAATVVHGGGSVAAARERPAGLPGAPPSGHAGGRGWRGALVRRLEGHRAPRHPCRAARLRLGRADRGGPQQGPRPRPSWRTRPITSGRWWRSARRRPRSRPPSTGVRPVRPAVVDGRRRRRGGVARSRRRRRAPLAGVRVVRLVRLLRRARRRLRPGRQLAAWPRRSLDEHATRPPPARRAMTSGRPDAATPRRDPCAERRGSKTYVGLLAIITIAQPARARDGAVGVVGGRPRRLRVLLVRRDAPGHVAGGSAPWPA